MSFKKKGVKCLFCDNTNLSRTHIFPNWLNRKLPSGRRHLARRKLPSHSAQVSATEVKQGGIFAQKPYLACENCNTGWMAGFENYVAPFGKQLLLESNPIRVSTLQVRRLAGWIALITVLAERIDTSKLSWTIPEKDRRYLKVHLVPPPDWSIFAVSSSGRKWAANWWRQSRYVGKFESRDDYIDKVAAGVQGNTGIFSFGMGKIFFQVFHSVDSSLVADYRRRANAGGLVQIWPQRSLFSRLRQPTKFPTVSVLTDAKADELCHAYHRRIIEMSKPFNA